VQEAFLEVNNSLLPDPMQIHTVPDELFTAEMLTSAGARPLRVLSLGTSNDSSTFDKLCLMMKLTWNRRWRCPRGSGSYVAGRYPEECSPRQEALRSV